MRVANNKNEDTTKQEAIAVDDMIKNLYNVMKAKIKG